MTHPCPTCNSPSPLFLTNLFPFVLVVESGDTSAPCIYVFSTPHVLQPRLKQRCFISYFSVNPLFIFSVQMASVQLSAYTNRFCLKYLGKNAIMLSRNAYHCAGYISDSLANDNSNPLWALVNIIISVVSIGATLNMSCNWM